MNCRESDGGNMKQYKVGDYLMHEGSGVCQVKEIRTMALQGKGSEKDYYVLTPVFQKDSQIITPVNGSRQRIRDVKSPEEMNEIFEEVKDLDIIQERNDRVRAEKYKEAMAEFEPIELARVVKTVYERRLKRIAAGKKIMSQDERTLSVAGRKLFEEMAFSLQETMDEVENKFYDVLKKDVHEELSVS